MYKVVFWSIILDKYVTKQFGTFAEAKKFAIEYNGIIKA